MKDREPSETRTSTTARAASMDGQTKRQAAKAIRCILDEQLKQAIKDGRATPENGDGDPEIHDGEWPNCD